uniref:Uncharacterized protein n=1 Tax=Lepisosteus oculatus TaxID=7918 RepID=W5LZU3_LEPOC
MKMKDVAESLLFSPKQEKVKDKVGARPAMRPGPVPGCVARAVMDAYCFIFPSHFQFFRPLGEVVAPLPGADPPDPEEEMEVWSSETRVADSPSSWRPCPHGDQTRLSDAAASGAEQSAGAVPSSLGPPSLAGGAGQSCTLERHCRVQRNQLETRQESAEPPAPSGTAAGSLVLDLEELETEGAPGSSVEGRLAGMAHVGLADVDVWPCEEERTRCSSPCTEIPRTGPSADDPQRPVSPEGRGCCCPLSSGAAAVSPHAGGSCAHCSRRLPVLVGDGITGPRAAGGDCDGRTEGRLGGAEGDGNGRTEGRLGGAEGGGNGRTEGHLGGAEGGSKGRTEGHLGGAEGDGNGRTEGRLGGAEGDSDGQTEGHLGGAEGDSDGQTEECLGGTEGHLGGAEGDSDGQAEECLGGAEGDSDAGTSPSISGPPSQGTSLERAPAGGEVDLPAADRGSSGEIASASRDCASPEGGGASPCMPDTQEGVSAVAGLLQEGLIEERQAEQQNLEAHKDRDPEVAMCRSPSIELRAGSSSEMDTSVSTELRAGSSPDTDTLISPELRARCSPER